MPLCLRGEVVEVLRPISTLLIEVDAALVTRAPELVLLGLLPAVEMV